MARAKKSKPKETKTKETEPKPKKIEECVFRPANEVIRPAQYLHTTPCLDLRLNGGLALGQMLAIKGKPGACKSAFACHLAAQAQKQLGWKILGIDLEFKTLSRDDYLEGMTDIDRSKMDLLDFTDLKHVTRKTVLHNIEQKIREIKEPCFILIDSISDGLSEDVYNEGLNRESSRLGGFSQLMGEFASSVMPVIYMTNSILCMIIQYRSKIQMTNAPAPSPQGGYQLNHKLNTILELQVYQSKDIKHSDDNVKDQILGTNVLVGIEKSFTCPLSKKDNRVEILVRTPGGVDITNDVFILGCAIGYIEVGGSWYNFKEIDGIEPKKVQGKEKALDVLKDNPEYTEKLHKEIRSMLIETNTARR